MGNTMWQSHHPHLPVVGVSWCQGPGRWHLPTSCILPPEPGLRPLQQVQNVLENTNPASPKPHHTMASNIPSFTERADLSVGAG